MTFFYLTNFLYVKTVLTIWSVSQFAIFKNRHVFADPITYVTEHGKRAQLTFKIILSFSAKLRLRSILGKTFLAAIHYLQQFTYLRVKF